MTNGPNLFAVCGFVAVNFNTYKILGCCKVDKFISKVCQFPGSSNYIWFFSACGSAGRVTKCKLSVTHAIYSFSTFNRGHPHKQDSRNDFGFVLFISSFPREGDNF